jgi:hypothetical protein
VLILTQTLTLTLNPNQARAVVAELAPTPTLTLALVLTLIMCRRARWWLICAVWAWWAGPCARCRPRRGKSSRAYAPDGSNPRLAGRSSCRQVVFCHSHVCASLWAGVRRAALPANPNPSPNPDPNPNQACGGPRCLLDGVELLLRRGIELVEDKTAELIEERPELVELHPAAQPSPSQ